jgi:hypothetical protein
MIIPDYDALRRKGYTHTLIIHLAMTNRQRLQEIVCDPWQYPFLGDPSAPVQLNPPIHPARQVTVAARKRQHGVAA